MNFDGAERRQLTRDECLRLIGSVPVGRVVYTRQALPAVDLVDFTVDDGDIVFRTDAGSKLAAATRGTVVAFEADRLDLNRQTGWSVTLIGQCQAVTDSRDIARLRGTSPAPWAPGWRDLFVRIPPQIISGRELTRQPVEMPGHAHSL